MELLEIKFIISEFKEIEVNSEIDKLINSKLTSKFV